MAEFASLHTHTHNSILDGYSTIPEYVARAQEIGMRGLGLSDHGNLFGVNDFLKATKAVDIKGLPGCEFYVAPENPKGAFVQSPIFYGPDGKKAGTNDVSSGGSYLHMTIWAYNNTGLHNLFRLSTFSYNPDRFYSKPRIDFEMLAQYSEGLIVSTGCPSSEISTRFLLGQDQKAYEYASRLVDVFGKDRVYVEIMDHSMDISLERDLLPKQVKLAKKMGLKLLATNDSHYANPKDAPHHEEMLAKQSGTRMSDASYDEGGRRFAFSGDGYYLKGASEMELLFPERDFPNALKSSIDIMEMIEPDLGLKFDPHLRPSPKIPEGHDLKSYYRSKVRAGLKSRYKGMSKEVQAEALERSKIEDEVIVSSGFAGYMLVVEDYLRFARENFSTRNEEGEILASAIGVGRGSVGGSIHAYALGISELDPVRFNLIFQRFLSAGRGAQFRVTYEDGTYEDIIASDTRILESGEAKYIHELEIGETVKLQTDVLTHEDKC